MAIVLSLLAALTYGLADFAGGVAAKRTSAWAVAFVAQVAGTFLVAALGLFSSGDPTSSDVVWGLVAGVGNGLGTAFLYRGLSSGRMGVVAPVSGVGAVVVPVIVGFLSGERPPALVWAGIALALPAIWLVAREPSVDVAGAPEPPGSGLLDGVLAGLGFGGMFAALAQVSPDAGLMPLALNQGAAGVTIVVVAAVVGQPWVPRSGIAWVGAIAGLLGATATVFFLLATREGFLSVTAVLTSLYPAFTVLLAAGVLHEHVHRMQAVGLALCAAAVTLVALG